MDQHTRTPTRWCDSGQAFLGKKWKKWLRVLLLSQKLQYSHLPSQEAVWQPIWSGQQQVRLYLLRKDKPS